MKAYQGNEPYIFISYAHADSSRVLPILEALDAKGYRVWYDGGIAVGSEWPEYIAEHLNGCTAFICFISKTSLDSQNCRREINFAIARKKTTVAVYLEEFAMSLGMELQLGTLQSMFYTRHETLDSFVDALADAKELQNCRGDAPVLPKKEEAPPKGDPTPIEEEENPFRARLNARVIPDAKSFFRHSFKNRHNGFRILVRVADENKRLFSFVNFHTVASRQIVYFHYSETDALCQVYE